MESPCEKRDTSLGAQASRCSTRSPEPAFIVGLLQSGLINVDDLQRTFSDELHANELVLLAC